MMILSIRPPIISNYDINNIDNTINIINNNDNMMILSIRPYIISNYNINNN